MDKPACFRIRPFGDNVSRTGDRFVRIHIYPARDQPRPANASAEKGCFLCDRDFVEVDTRVARVFDEEEAGKLLGFVCTDCLSKQEAIPARLRQTAEWHERFLREGQIPPALEVMVAYHASLRRRFAEEPLDFEIHDTSYKEGERQL